MTTSRILFIGLFAIPAALIAMKYLQPKPVEFEDAPQGQVEATAEETPDLRWRLHQPPEIRILHDDGYTSRLFCRTDVGTGGIMACKHEDLVLTYSLDR